MQATDIIVVQVTGTNGTTRHQKTISRTFNGAGQLLTDDGHVNTATEEVLRNLPGAGGAPVPEYPAEQAAAAILKTASSDPAVKAEGVKELKELQIAYAQQVNAWDQSQGGGTEKMQLAKSVLEYAKEFHNFSETDNGEVFVMKLENLEVTTSTLKDGRSLYQVAGTAIFG